MGPHPKNRTGVIWTWRTVRGQIANLTFWVTYYTLSNMAMDNPKPYVDHSLYLDGSGKASFLEAMRPKWLQLAVLHRRKSRSLKFQNHRMWFLSMLWTCELDRRMEHDGAAEHCRAAKGSKRRISKTSQCIKTIHFLGFMHCTPEELVSWWLPAPKTQAKSGHQNGILNPLRGLHIFWTYLRNRTSFPAEERPLSFFWGGREF